jgi:hypothetical protein
MVIIVITIALIAIGTLAFRPTPTPGCTSPPGFNCNFIAISTNGILTAKISQAIGSPLVINGAACADQQNYTSDAPRYGNIGVNAIPSYYPISSVYETGNYPPGNTIYSGGYYVFYVYCYQLGASVAKGNIGSQFTGYLWLNYTIPNYGSQVQKIATFTAEYS